MLSLLFGSYGLEPFLASPNGFAGWLFQSAWVPQHLMSAGCVVAADAAVVHCAQRQTVGRLLTLVLLIVAGFESSTFVGGVTFAIAAVAAAPILLATWSRHGAFALRRPGGGSRARACPRRAIRSRSIRGCRRAGWRPAARRCNISRFSARMFPDTLRRVS